MTRSPDIAADKYGNREWRIPANEHRIAYIDLSNGTLTLTYVDIESHRQEEEIFTLDNFRSLDIVLGTDQSLTKIADDSNDKYVGMITDGLVYWVFRLETFPGTKGILGVAYILPKGHIDLPPKFST